MESYEPKIDNSIDDAIENCQKTIEVHRGKANNFLKIIIATLLFFGTLQILNFALIGYNQNKVSRFIDIINLNVKHIEKNKTEERAIVSYVNFIFEQFSNLKDTAHPAYYKTESYKEVVKSHRLAYYKILDSLRSDQSLGDSVIFQLRTLPTELKSSLLKIDNTAIYILYGLFLLVFGILTSFYRFHLKEISKYEHFLFGFLRIRIAGNNSKTKYDDEVKISLTKDAFAMEQRAFISKDRKIESPMPGHPSSDALTFVLNKILDSIEITNKKK